MLNGFAGPIAMSAPPVISAVWFPPRQRTTATSIMASANYLGVAVAFIWGPAMLKSYNSDTKDQARLYMLYETLFGAVVFCCTLVHMPDRPRSSPSRSSTEKRTSFLKGLKQVHPFFL